MNELGNSDASKYPNGNQPQLQPGPQMNELGNSDASKYPNGNQPKLQPGPQMNELGNSDDGNNLKPIFRGNQNSTNPNSSPSNNTNQNQAQEKHYHSEDTIIKQNVISKELKPENITDPMARQKFQKAQSDLSKNNDKLKNLENKKKEIVKSINELYNKITSESQSREILAPKAQMDKSKLEKSQQVIDIAKQISEQFRKDSENFLAQKQALNSTQEAKKLETQVFEKSFQEQKGKFDKLNQKKKETTDTISQYDSNGEFAAKKIKANLENKTTLQRQIEKIQISIDKSAKEIEEKSQHVKTIQENLDNLTKKVDKLNNEIKLFEESQKNVSKKQDDIGKQIDKAEDEKLKKQGYEALTKLNELDGPLASAKKAIVNLVDNGILTVLENSYNMVVDKDNNDSTSLDREMSKIPKFIWNMKK
jgi:chromosome segregation ATPase